MGLQHGEALRSQINALVHSTKLYLQHLGLSLAEITHRVKALIPFAEERFPHLTEEVRGIAAGAGVAYLEAFLLQVRFEIICCYAPPLDGECTLFGVNKQHNETGHAVIGQNMDLSPYNQDFVVLLHLIPKDAPEILTVSLSGILAQEGINSEGLGLCGSMVVPRVNRLGLPNRNFLRRALMEQATIEGALRLIEKSVPRATGHNLMLTDATEQIVDVELTADSFAVLEPDAQGVLAHTNHYLHEGFIGLDVLNDKDGVTFAGPASLERLEGSKDRLQRMTMLLHSKPDTLGLSDFIQFLSDHHCVSQSICRHAEADPCRVSTVSSLVSIPSQRRMYATFGQPCQSAFERFEL